MAQPNLENNDYSFLNQLYNDPNTDNTVIYSQINAKFKEHMKVCIEKNMRAMQEFYAKNISAFDNAKFGVPSQYYKHEILLRIAGLNKIVSPPPNTTKKDLINNALLDIYVQKDIGNYFLHLWTFKTPTFALNKYKNVKSILMVLLFLLLFGW